MTYEAQIASDDIELMSASSEETAAEVPRWTPLRAGLVAVGLGLVASCLVAGLALRTHGALADATAPVASARDLLESPEMVDEASRNFAAWSNGKVDASSPTLRRSVREALAKITAQLRKEKPESFARLESRKLSTNEKADMLKVVAGMRHPGVQSLGRELAEAVSGAKQTGREGLEKDLEQRFSNRVPILRQLQDEVFPESLRRVASDLGNSKITIRTNKLRIVKEFPGSWKMDMKVRTRRLSTSASSTSDVSEVDPGSILSGADMDGLAKQFEEGLGIVSGIIEQVRVLLDQTDFISDAFGTDAKIPYWAKSLVGGLDFVSELSDCVMRSHDNEVKLLMCPAKYASAATDFLEALDNVMGMDGANFFGSPSPAGAAPAPAAGAWGAPPASAPAASGWGAAPAPAAPPASAWGPAPAPAAAPPQGGSLWGR